MSAARDKKPSPEVPGTRQRLLEAARAEFSERGIEAATTRKIAERAGCNEVTLFRLFETKQKLLGAVVQETSEKFLKVCECGGDEFSGDAGEDLGRFAAVYNNALENCEGMMRAMIGEGRRRPLLAKELIGDVLEPFHRSIARYLDQLQQSGTVRADLDTHSFAEILTSALMGGLLRRASGLSNLDRDAWLRETVNLLVRGIGP